MIDGYLVAGRWKLVLFLGEPFRGAIIYSIIFGK